MTSRDSGVYQALELLTSGKCYIDEANCQEGIEGLKEYNNKTRTAHSASKKPTDILEKFLLYGS